MTRALPIVVVKKDFKIGHKRVYKKGLPLSERDNTGSANQTPNRHAPNRDYQSIYIMGLSIVSKNAMLLSLISRFASK